METQQKIERLYAKYAATLDADSVDDSDDDRKKTFRKATNYLRQIEALFPSVEEYRAYIQSKIPTSIIISQHKAQDIP